MKRKGFTLIELLAVIVILAIIALIATPIIMNTIDNSKKEAAKRSAERYVAAVETMIATKRLDNEIVADGLYLIPDSGFLSYNDGDASYTVEMNGKVPTSGAVKIQNGQVVKAPGTVMTIGEYSVSYDANSKMVATKIE